MTTEEKILYVQQLWDYIAQTADDESLTDVQREELDRRVAAYRARELTAHSWDETRRWILDGG